MRLADLSPLQVRRARAIYDAALPFGREAVKAALMTAADESSFLLYGNDGSTRRSDVPQRWRDVAATSLRFNPDRVAPALPPDTPEGHWDTTADSVGHFQQRPMFDYGTVAELMDPAESTRIFIRGSHGGTGRTKRFLDAPADLSIAAQCQWVQGSEFPDGVAYAPMEAVADELIALFGPIKSAGWWAGWFKGE